MKFIHPIRVFGTALMCFFYKCRMDMIDGVPTADFDVLDRMWGRFPGPVDEGDQSRICTQVNDIAEYAKVTYTHLID
jgi:hypothetical protein